MASTPNQFAPYLVDPKYSDLEIRCAGRVFKVHRVIVCSASEVLAKECDGMFQESSSRVSQHSVFSASTMELMLQFMYTGLYTFACAEAADATQDEEHPSVADLLLDSEVTSSKSLDLHSEKAETEDSAGTLSLPISSILTHIDVYAIADYYDVSALKTRALENFSACQGSIRSDDFAEVLRAVYTCTAKRDDPLRSEIVEEVSRRDDTLMYNKSFMLATAEVPDLQHFVADLLPILHRKAKSASEEKEESDRLLANERTEREIDRQEADERRAGFQNSIDDTSTALEQTALLTERTTSCRNCHKDFNSYLEGVASSIRLSRPCYLRCRGCNCRHTV